MFFVDVLLYAAVHLLLWLQCGYRMHVYPGVRKIITNNLHLAFYDGLALTSVSVILGLTKLKTALSLEER